MVERRKQEKYFLRVELKKGRKKSKKMIVFLGMRVKMESVFHDDHNITLAPY